MWQDMGAGLLQAAMASLPEMNPLLAKGDMEPVAKPGEVRSPTRLPFAQERPTRSVASDRY